MCLKISDLLFKVFGVWLSQQELGSDGIPHLVAKCLQFVETYGMSVSMLISSRSGKSRDYRDVIIFECFSSTRKWKAGVFKSSGLNSVFDDLRFRDRLVWTERRLRFQISPAQCGSCLTSHLCFFFNPGGLEMEGVYRVNGGQLTMKKLRTSFDQGKLSCCVCLFITTSSWHQIQRGGRRTSRI